ncbi:unnamed protein product [Ranitomeya imitator]|uniref:Uncharacterized protein n=1 Tax=Ranitomeya imitator TaxID=111125 RepID=A0ABN9L0B6_9NEOB|nr:unnamed protein product [Ranitomeya imitator]
MYNKFRERGYPPNLLADAINPLITPRSPANKRIPFVHVYHPYVRILHNTIRRHWNMLHTALPDIPEFREHFLLCYKRPPNIRDSLVKADFGGKCNDTIQRFLSKPKQVTFPCLHCNQCNNVIRGDSFTHLHSVPCCLLYIGETTQSIKDCFSKNKSTIRCKNMLLPLPYHFISQGHSISQLKFQVGVGDRIHLLKNGKLFGSTSYRPLHQEV